MPSYRKTSAEVREEAVKAIVRPSWDRIEAQTEFSRSDLMNQPDTLKRLIWQSINKCQQENQDLAGFERISSGNLVEIKIDEFQKTSTGKIKRNHYIELAGSGL